jgi:twitching motility protein PilT
MALDLHSILNLAVRERASDVHLKAGLPPILRIYGNLIPVKNQNRLTPDEVKKVTMRLMNEKQKEIFKDQLQIDLAYSVPGLGRFRINIFKQRGAMGAVLRVVPIVIKGFEELRLPKVLENVALEQRGLILATGITGSGKSTTIASMIEHINNNKTCNIVTIEDPVEFLFKDKKCLINQRELGVDTHSFADALRGALRQDPDVIMVGEMRDLETMQIALTAAETGHLVFSTLHTLDATETISRIISVFPPYQQKQVRMQLAGVIKVIISQRLMPTKDGKSRVPAVEIMISTARIRECIEDKEKTKEIHDAISKGHTTYEMQTFDQSIMDLLNRDYISYDEALRQTTNPDDFVLKLKGVTSDSDMGWKDFMKGKEVKKKVENDEEEPKLEIDRF